MQQNKQQILPLRSYVMRRVITHPSVRTIVEKLSSDSRGPLNSLQTVCAQCKAYSQGSGQDTIPNTNVAVEAPPPPKQSDYAFSGVEGAKNENLTEPDNKGPTVSATAAHPPPEAEGGAAFIPNTNVEVTAPPPPTSSDSAFSGSNMMRSSSRAAVSLDEGTHSEQDREHEMTEAIGSKEERSTPGLHSGD